MALRTVATIISAGTTGQRGPVRSGPTIIACFAFLLGMLSVGAGASLPNKSSLHRVLGIAGEVGVIASQGNSLTMFSDQTIRIQEGMVGGWQHVASSHGAFTVEVVGNQWKKGETHLPLSAARRPGLCDPLNQVNISSTHAAMARALPVSARIKAVQEGNGFSLVAYSASDTTVGYDVRVALLEPTKENSYVLAATDLATEYGTFCGIQPIGGDHFLVIVHEPTGSSEFLAVYVYAVTKSD